MQKLIFIVDDNDANLAFAASVLENEYRVLTMPSAQRMFLLLEKKRPDMILLDVEMPDMSGFDAIARLKANPEWEKIPVIFLTGWIDGKLLSDAQELGSIEVIPKPINPSVLLNCVKKSTLNNEPP